MLARLSTADFGDDHLGFVEFRTDTSQDTKDLLAIFGKTWTLTQQLAIEDFMTAFNAASWKTKVKYMFIPIMAPVSSLVNATSDATLNKVGYDIANSVFVKSALKTDEGLCSVGQNGITRTAIGTASWIYSFYYMLSNIFSVANGGHHGLYYRMGANTGGSSNDFAFAPEGAYNQWRETYYRNGNSTRIWATYDTNKKNLRGFRFVSYDNAGDVTAINDSVAIPTVTGTASDFGVEGTDVKCYVGSDSAGNSCEDIEVSFLTFGDHMTNAESLAYSALVETLMDALWTE